MWLHAFLQYFPVISVNFLVSAIDLYQGMWDCEADEENELSFKRGQIVHVISKVNWCAISLFT